MKTSDLDLKKDLKMDPRTGIASIRDSRVLILDAEVFGLIREEVIEELGQARAKDFFLRVGFQHGYADFMRMNLSHEFDDDTNLLLSASCLQAWEGWAQAKPRELRFNRQTGDFLSTGSWNNSFEAEQHLFHHPPIREPVCWTMMGYSSGWCSAFAGTLIISIETSCVGMGDPHCEWRGQLPVNWGQSARTYYRVYQDLLSGGVDGRRIA